MAFDLTLFAFDIAGKSNDVRYKGEGVRVICDENENLVVTGQGLPSPADLRPDPKYESFKSLNVGRKIWYTITLLNSCPTFSTIKPNPKSSPSQLSRLKSISHNCLVTSQAWGYRPRDAHDWGPWSHVSVDINYDALPLIHGYHRGRCFLVECWQCGLV